MLGAQLAVSTIGAYFAERLVQTLNTALIVVLFSVANFLLYILLFFLTKRISVAAGAKCKSVIAKAMRYFIPELSLMFGPVVRGGDPDNNAVG